jgi:hypothetical protein
MPPTRNWTDALFWVSTEPLRTTVGAPFGPVMDQFKIWIPPPKVSLNEIAPLRSSLELDPARDAPEQPTKKGNVAAKSEQKTIFATSFAVMAMHLLRCGDGLTR